MSERKSYNMIDPKRVHRYLQVLAVLGYLCRLHGRNYCFPSQEKIIKLLKEKYGVSYCRRHLNRILNAFEYGGYFKRIRRMQKGKDGGLVRNSTLYLLTSKAFKVLGKMGLFLKNFILEGIRTIKEEVKNIAHGNAGKGEKDEGKEMTFREWIEMRKKRGLPIPNIELLRSFGIKA